MRDISSNLFVQKGVQRGGGVTVNKVSLLVHNGVIYTCYSHLVINHKNNVTKKLYDFKTCNKNIFII